MLHGFLWAAVLLSLSPAAYQACPQTEPKPAVPNAEEVIAKVSPSVALILVADTAGRLSGLGSGVVVRPEGVLLTAYHVVKKAQAVQVRLHNGEIYDRVELIGVDERRDVAALRIAAGGLTALNVAPAEEAKPGETVYVVSNPGGLSWSASSGILSAWRPADAVPGAGSGYRLIQFTAPVSPGSSGGALVNGKGKVLGIVLGAFEGQNLNFAVPVESVLGLASGSERRAFASGSELRLPQAEPVQASKAAPPEPPRPAAPGPAAGEAKTSPTDVARSARTVFIAGTEAFPAEPLEKKLFEEKEFKSGELLIVQRAAGADLRIDLDRKAWTWDFTYRMIDPARGLILGSGKVIAWDGVRAAPGIAHQVIERLRALRKPPAPPPAERKQK